MRGGVRGGGGASVVWSSLGEEGEGRWVRMRDGGRERGREGGERKGEKGEEREGEKERREEMERGGREGKGRRNERKHSSKEEYLPYLPHCLTLR